MTAHYKYLFRAALVGVCCVVLLGAATAQDIVTTSFQNGANGYTGTFDRGISDVASQETDLGGVAYGWLDGVDISLSPPVGDRQILMRFDNIFGTGQNQIPTGATILEAELILATGLAGNAQTGGPFGVAGLLQAFDSTTSYFMDFESATEFESRGAWWKDGYATRPVGCWGFMNPGTVGGTNVVPIVQSWANGSPNYGFVIQAGMGDLLEAGQSNTTDGWAIRTTGFPYSDQRPKLEVSYTTAEVIKTSFQEGTNGYTGTTMAIVSSGPNALIYDEDGSEITVDASLTEQPYLDGVIFTDSAGNTNSQDRFGLLKFDNIFGSGAVPTTIPVAKAWAVITSGDDHKDTRSQGSWSIHTMLRPWDFTTLHSNIGAVAGLQVGDNDISPALDIKTGMIQGSEIWFDVTDYVEGLRTGAVDYGLAIQAYNTGDGWFFHSNGSSLTEARPRLVVYSAFLGGEPLEGDFDGDLDVDGADFLIWQQGFGTTYNAGDLAAWQSNFGTIQSSGPMATAIPEPSTLLLLMGAAIAVACARMRSFVA
ncbi:MAG: PEP-CTERM sorting domain-containing protein [Pirellulales bacterium]|nr:PEP-CTERM sorting domain-containing protein [Pirellulales bacterium]